jgi:hypothetical protein
MNMTTFKELAEAWIASREHCSGSLGRIRFWVDEFGPLQVDQISEDQVDQAINRLVARGKLKGGTGKDRGEPTGQPLSGSTINRFVSTLAGLFKYARRFPAAKTSSCSIQNIDKELLPKQHFVGR